MKRTRGPGSRMHRHAFEVGYPLAEISALHADGWLGDHDFLVAAGSIITRAGRETAVEPSDECIHRLACSLRAVERGDDDLRLDDLHYAIRCWSDELRHLAGCNEPTVPL